MDATKRNSIAEQTIDRCPEDSLVDHIVIANAIKRGYNWDQLADLPELNRWPSTYSWLKDEFISMDDASKDNDGFPIIARRRTDGNYAILYAWDGYPVTRLDGCRPIGSNLGGAYEHAEGIILDFAQVKELGIFIEKSYPTPSQLAKLAFLSPEDEAGTPTSRIFDADDLTILEGAGFIRRLPGDEGRYEVVQEAWDTLENQEVPVIAYCGVEVINRDGETATVKFNGDNYRVSKAALDVNVPLHGGCSRDELFRSWLAAWEVPAPK